MDHHQHDGGHPPGLATPLAAELNPTSDSACVTSAGRHGDHENEHGDSAEATAAAKREATVRSQLALAGFELRRTVEGPLLVLRWGRVRELHDVEAAEAFAVTVGARP